MDVFFVLDFITLYVTTLLWQEQEVSEMADNKFCWFSQTLQELTDTKTFKRKLKTFLFQQAYN